MHLAVRAMSVRDPRRPFTATGLGDRIHQVTVGWAYGHAHRTPVTLHLTREQMTGGQFQNKPESWAEIVDLFPRGAVACIAHPVSPLRETDWWTYLRRRGYDARGFWYADHPGRYEPPAAIDIAPYLRSIPPLDAVPQAVALPERFCTVQFDSNDRKRSLSAAQRARIVDRYWTDGYEPLTVGGEAAEPLRWSLRHIAYAMSMAAFHVGVDSAFLHLAQLYMPWDRIHLYTGEFLSHHALRAIDNGARVNLHL